MAAGSVVEPHRFDDGAQVALDVEPFLQHRLDGLRPELEAGDVADQEIESFEAVGMPAAAISALASLSAAVDPSGSRCAW